MLRHHIVRAPTEFNGFLGRGLSTFPVSTTVRGTASDADGAAVGLAPDASTVVVPVRTVPSGIVVPAP